MPTVLRPHIRQALESIYAQDLSGTIQILVGIDKALGSKELLNELISAAPNNVRVTVLDPGYSTSSRHGGMHSCFYGGALRTVLSYLANSQYVAYLDDDDWFAPNHLSSLLSAIKGNDVAYSLRWYAHPQKQQGICIDNWESVGPGQGVYKERFGGFIAPSCLMLDKMRCQALLPLWSLSPFKSGDGEDRLIFDAIIHTGLKYASNNEATSFCSVDPYDSNHRNRLEWMRQAGVAVESLADIAMPSDRLLSRSHIDTRQTAIDLKHPD